MTQVPACIDRAPDVLVLGGGAGGLAAARTAVRRGATTLLVQQGPLGGDCTFTGCVPSKAVIEAAADGASFGDAMAAAGAAVRTIAAAEDDAVLRREGVGVLHGWCFVAPKVVEVDGTLFRPRHVVVATGAGPSVPPIPGLGDVDHLTNETIFQLTEAPASMVVLGGGPIGCELAQALLRLGVAVTLVEASDRLLAREEPEASAVVAAALTREGVDVVLEATVVRVEGHRGNGTAVRVHLDDGRTVDAERVLVSVGRRAATDGLGLDEAGVDIGGGLIVTTDTLATSARGVWAVGDVAGKLQLTHAADEMGRLAVGNALSRLPPRRFRAEWVPWVTFTAPEVARIGLSEADTASAGGRVAYLPMSEVDRAITARTTDGFVKLVAVPRRGIGNAGGGHLVGATIVAARGGEMIAEAALAVRTGMFVGRLAQTVHAYPTWSTAVRQAAAQYFMEVGGRQARAAVAD